MTESKRSRHEILCVFDLFVHRVLACMVQIGERLRSVVPLDRLYETDYFFDIIGVGDRAALEVFVIAFFVDVGEVFC